MQYREKLIDLMEKSDVVPFGNFVAIVDRTTGEPHVIVVPELGMRRKTAAAVIFNHKTQQVEAVTLVMSRSVIAVKNDGTEEYAKQGIDSSDYDVTVNSFIMETIVQKFNDAPYRFMDWWFYDFRGFRLTYQRSSTGGPGTVVFGLGFDPLMRFNANLSAMTPMGKLLEHRGIKTWVSYTGLFQEKVMSAQGNVHYPIGDGRNVATSLMWSILISATNYLRKEMFDGTDQRLA